MSPPPPCGARTRKGTTCTKFGTGLGNRCRYHGGIGPKTPGAKLRHGRGMMKHGKRSLAGKRVERAVVAWRAALQRLARGPDPEAWAAVLDALGERRASVEAFDVWLRDTRAALAAGPDEAGSLARTVTEVEGQQPTQEQPMPTPNMHQTTYHTGPNGTVHVRYSGTTTPRALAYGTSSAGQPKIYALAEAAALREGERLATAEDLLAMNPALVLTPLEG